MEPVAASQQKAHEFCATSTAFRLRSHFRIKKSLARHLSTALEIRGKAGKAGLGCMVNYKGNHNKPSLPVKVQGRKHWKLRTLGTLISSLQD